MARTQAPDYEQRQEAIVEKAADLFARQGFRGASVAELAEACNTSKSLLYHYFASKEDVLYAVMASHIDQLLEDVSDASALSRQPREVLGHLLRAFMRHYIGAASRQKVLLNELGALPADKQALIVNKQRRILDVVQKLLTEINPELADKPAEARVKTMLIFGMINWTHTWFDVRGPISADAIADMVLELIDGAGICAPSKSSAKATARATR